MTQTFRKELDYFISHQEELVKKYNGKVLVIKGEEIIGVFDSPMEAYLETKKEHEVGSYIIQPCEPGPDAYSVTISSTDVMAA